MGFKDTLKKKWQGVKNLFGNEGAKDAKSALEKLRNTAKKQYADLDANNTGGLSDQILAVWTDLKAALAAVLSMCGVEEDKNGRGRAYAKFILKDNNIKEVPTTFNAGALTDFNDLESQVVNLQLVANKTDRTSAIPSVIQDAAKETSRFYAYAYAYACAGTIDEKMEEINGVLQKEKNLCKQIQNISSKNKVEFIEQCEVDAKKVAKEIYKQVKDVKAQKEIKTAGFMKNFVKSLKKLFGMYTEPEVVKKITDETNNNNSLKNDLKETLTNNPKGLSNSLNIQLKDSTNNINNKISSYSDNSNDEED